MSWVTGMEIEFTENNLISVKDSTFFEMSRWSV